MLTRTVPSLRMTASMYKVDKDKNKQVKAIVLSLSALYSENCHSLCRKTGQY